MPSKNFAKQTFTKKGITENIFPIQANLPGNEAT
jgi:hypothetical protein